MTSQSRRILSKSMKEHGSMSPLEGTRLAQASSMHSWLSSSLELGEQMQGQTEIKCVGMCLRRMLDTSRVFLFSFMRQTSDEPLHG